MAFFQWTDDLSVGIEEIDSQHRGLVELIDGLHQAMTAKKSREAVGDVVSALIAYVKGHFATEERYFAETDYPETHAHRLEHVEFAKKAVEFERGLAAGRITLSVDVMFFLKDWLQEHIAGTDRKYVDWFKQHGIG